MIVDKSNFKFFQHKIYIQENYIHQEYHYEKIKLIAERNGFTTSHENFAHR